MLALLVLCKYLFFFLSLLSFCCFLSPSVLSRKDIYLSMNLAMKIFCLCACRGHILLLFSSLTCSLTVNQCSVRPFLVHLLAYRVCLCTSSIIIQIALISQVYVKDVRPFWLRMLETCLETCAAGITLYVVSL